MFCAYPYQIFKRYTTINNTWFALFNSILPWSKSLECKAYGLFTPCCRNSRVIAPTLFDYSVLFSRCKTISGGCGSPGGRLSESQFSSCEQLCSLWGGGFAMWKAFGRLPGLLSRFLMMLAVVTSEARKHGAWRQLTLQAQEVVFNDMSVDLRRARAT